MTRFIRNRYSNRVALFCFRQWNGNAINKLSNILNSYLTPAMYKGAHQKKCQKRVITVSMDTTTDPMEANRIALRRMFKAIAEYGREVRLRRLANGGAPTQETPDGLAPKRETQPARHRKPRRKKGST